MFKKGNVKQMSSRFGMVFTGGKDCNINLNQFDRRYINQEGDVLNGNIDMSGHAILNVKTPTDSKDVVNKVYSDLKDNDLQSQIERLRETNDAKSQLINHELNSIENKLRKYLEFPYKSYKELEYTLTNGMITVSSEYSSSYSKDKMLDNSNSSYWASNSSTSADWIKITFPKEINITKIKLRQGYPKANKLLFKGSQNDELHPACEIFYKKDLHPSLSDGTWVEFEIPYNRSKKYRYYYIVIDKTSQTSSGFYKLQLWYEHEQINTINIVNYFNYKIAYDLGIEVKKLNPGFWLSGTFYKKLTPNYDSLTNNIGVPYDLSRNEKVDPSTLNEASHPVSRELERYLDKDGYFLDFLPGKSVMSHNQNLNDTYTIFCIFKQPPGASSGRFITGNTGNRVLFYYDNKIDFLYLGGEILNNELLILNNEIQFCILESSGNTLKYYRNGSKIFYSSANTLDFGGNSELVVGKPIIHFTQSTRMFLYEIILFKKILNVEQMELVKNYLKTIYRNINV